jgi:hypothetical protein
MLRSAVQDAVWLIPVVELEALMELLLRTIVVVFAAYEAASKEWRIWLLWGSENEAPTRGWRVLLALSHPLSAVSLGRSCRPISRSPRCQYVPARFCLLARTQLAPQHSPFSPDYV